MTEFDPHAARPRHARTKALEPALSGRGPTPPPPPGLHLDVVRWWHEFHRSEVAAAVVMSSDRPALERLAKMMSLRIQLQERLDTDGPIVEGSRRQPVPHPLIRAITLLDAEIRQSSAAFGLTPRHRLALGIALTKVRRGLNDLTDENDTQPLRVVTDADDLVD